MKRALACSADGFIGAYLAKMFKKEEYRVWGIDLNHTPFAPTYPLKGWLKKPVVA